MATVIETPDPAPQFAAKVDEQLAEATSRIRGHDLALGGLLVGGLVLGYAAGMMLLDRTLILPEWVRQLAFVAFLAVTATTAYRMLVRPLRQRVNPMYAAAAVERTIDDAKNSVVGYVEAQERGDVHPTVKAAMGARAAMSVDDADVNRAVDHRSLVYAGAAVVALFLTLVVLFFLFRPTQFQSLLGRAFAPFSSGAIAGRTNIVLIEPQGGDVTATAGQSITVKVEVTGSVPKPDRPDKVRLLVRYNPAAAEYDELPLEPGETSREWLVQVRPEQLRTGAWYKVAGGDTETPEYRVTVRTAPLFTDF
jgi:collagen type III alpha